MEENLFQTIRPLLDLLEGSLQTDGGLPYYPGNSSASEPTLLGLLAFFSVDRPKESFTPTLNWVMKTRNPDGSIGLNEILRHDGIWATAHSAIAFHWLGKIHERDEAINFLLNFRSVTVEVDDTVGLDSHLVGWPWVAKTFSWVEPTSFALLALTLSGQPNHARSVEGRKLLLDRCIQGGGWNCGNRLIYGNILLPFLDTTSIAILALASHVEESKLVQSLNIVETSGPTTESIYEMAWSIICLRLFKKETSHIEKKLLKKVFTIPNETLNLAHLGLALIALSQKPIFAL